MKDLVLHPQSRLQLQRQAKNPAQVILLIGAPGAGKKTVALALAAEILQLGKPKEIDYHPNLFRVSSELGKEITIDQIRELRKKLSLKSSGRKRLVLIEESHNMSLEAQNALLKTLEEPAGEVVFVLTAPSERQLLDTIVSRSQKLYLRPVSLPLADKHYKNSYPPSKIKNSWLLSEGNAGLMHSLIVGETGHPLNQAIAQAKKMLTQNRYERLVTLEQFYSNRQEFAVFLFALNRVLGALQRSAILKNNYRLGRRLLSDRQLVSSTAAALEQNVAPKIAGLKLIMNLRV